MSEAKKLIEINADIRCKCENAVCGFTRKSCPLTEKEDDRYYWKKNPQPADDLVEKIIEIVKAHTAITSQQHKDGSLDIHVIPQAKAAIRKLLKGGK